METSVITVRVHHVQAQKLQILKKHSSLTCKWHPILGQKGCICLINLRIGEHFCSKTPFNGVGFPNASYMAKLVVGFSKVWLLICCGQQYHVQPQGGSYIVVAISLQIFENIKTLWMSLDATWTIKTFLCCRVFTVLLANHQTWDHAQYFVIRFNNQYRGHDTNLTLFSTSSKKTVQAQILLRYCFTSH